MNSVRKALFKYLEYFVSALIHILTKRVLAVDLSPDYLWVVVCLESPDMSYCLLSNKLLGQSLNLESFDSKTKDVLCVSRFLTHINVCGNPPGRLCQPFLQFILNCKNHPNTCISSLPRPVWDTTTPSPPEEEISLHEVSPWLGWSMHIGLTDTQAAGN